MFLMSKVASGLVEDAFLSDWLGYYILVVFMAVFNVHVNRKIPRTNDRDLKTAHQIHRHLKIGQCNHENP